MRRAITLDAERAVRGGWANSTHYVVSWRTHLVVCTYAFPSEVVITMVAIRIPQLSFLFLVRHEPRSPVDDRRIRQ